jgi:hypothetical protein
VQYPLYHDDREIRVPTDPDNPPTISLLVPLAGPLPQAHKPEPLERLTPDERSSRARLTAHLNENHVYYWRQIWMGEDPNERINRLGPVKVDLGGSNPFLFDAVENRVVDVIGTSLVFPLADNYANCVKDILLPRVDVEARSETLISLPTRGVFGEAKLGHCNSAEVIDNTRFWDWKTSLCPDEAPAITGVSPQGLGSPTVPTPTPLPTSTLSIATPTPEPDPIGLRAALDVPKTPGIFNNMSGIQQLQGLLGSLSDAAAKVATAKTPGQAGPAPSPTPAPSPGPKPPTPQPPQAITPQNRFSVHIQFKMDVPLIMPNFVKPSFNFKQAGALLYTQSAISAVKMCGPAPIQLQPLMASNLIPTGRLRWMVGWVF